jgi:hypothetical protein
VPAIPSFTLADYRSQLAHSRIDPSAVQGVLAAWGQPREPAAWEVGFVIAFHAPGFGPEGCFRFAYLHGMRQGLHWLAIPDAVRLFRNEPHRLVDAAAWSVVQPGIGGPEQVAAPVAWQERPADLNQWHADGCP